MAVYEPLDLNIAIRSERCDLVELSSSRDGVNAIFSCSLETEKKWRTVTVFFEHVLGYRALDEVAHSVYGENGVDGIINGGFAYIVQNSTFSPFLKDYAAHFPTYMGDLTQYAFFSLNTVLDVLSLRAPSFSQNIDWRPNSRIRPACDL